MNDSVENQALGAGVDHLAAEVRSLKLSVDRDRGTRRALTVFTALLLALLLVVGMFAVFSLHELLSIGRQNRTNGRILIECTTKGNPLAANPQDRQHECYDAAQANQQAAVRQIVDANNNGVIDTKELLEAVNALTATTTTTTAASPPKR